jgi:hypothetical protein
MRQQPAPGRAPERRKAEIFGFRPGGFAGGLLSGFRSSCIDQPAAHRHAPLFIVAFAPAARRSAASAPIFRRGKINADVTGRLSNAAGAGQSHAEAERRADAQAARWRRG